MSKTHQATVEYNEDFDEYFITFPEELIVSTGWEEGDVLQWNVNKDGSVFVEKVDEFFEEEEIIND
jgi:bifunctional DNA-binding transcriptional regulator/antitoxin component of YhaV-PrlF toxin-antitoxin module